MGHKIWRIEELNHEWPALSFQHVWSWCCHTALLSWITLRLIPPFHSPYGHGNVCPPLSFNHQFCFPFVWTSREPITAAHDFQIYNQQVLFLQHLTETRVRLECELNAATLDVPTCGRMCLRSNAQHGKLLRCTLYSHARDPPNTPSVNWSLGSVGYPDSTSHWSGG